MARWLALAGITAYLLLIFHSYSKADPGWSHDNVVPKLHNWGGRIGAWKADLLLFIFGFSACLWCVMLLRSVWSGYRRLSQKFFQQQEPEAEHYQENWIRSAGFVLLLVGSVGLEHMRMYSL